MVTLIESAQANVAEMFAPSAKTLGLAGQTGTNNSDAENNYYAPSLLGFTKKDSSFSFSTFYINTDFNRITNVVTRNTLNSTSTTYNNVDTNYEATTMGAFHANIPLLKKLKTRLGISLYFPLDKLVESSTGDFWTPEYIFYRSRYNRSGFAFNIVQPYLKDWAFSFGLNGSFETVGETDLYAPSFNDPSSDSSGKMKFLVKPTVSPILSATKIMPYGTFSASYHHKVENTIETDATGYAPIGGVTTIPFDTTLKSMLYFDPSILRVNYKKSWQSFTVVSTIEYQVWSDYESPKIKIQSQSGFDSSTNYEDLDTEDIIVPKVAVSWRMLPTTVINAGAFYRPTPLKNDLNKAGNTIDSNVIGLSLGAGHQVRFLGETFNIFGAYQHQILENRTVTKTSGMEDGNAGSKVGAPGYSVGGTVQIVSFGVNWVL